MPKLSKPCEYCAEDFAFYASNPRRFCSRGCFHAATVSTFDLAAWYVANREQQNAKRLEWARANPEKRKAITQRWRDNNKDYARREQLRRLARHPADVTKQDLQDILASADGACTYCGDHFAKLEIDHVDPVCAGGTLNRDNILPACRTCNASKNAADVCDWLAAKHGVAGLARAVYFLENGRAKKAAA
jgi:5-methylcytosine-specific restriction endonuclease McrA